MPVRRAVHLSPLAERDLEDIWLYTAQRWSAGQADTYHGSIVAAFDDLARGKSGRPSDIRQGYWRIPAGSHVVYCREGPSGRTIDIIRILHQRVDAKRHL